MKGWKYLCFYKTHYFSRLFATDDWKPTLGQFIFKMFEIITKV